MQSYFKQLGTDICANFDGRGLMKTLVSGSDQTKTNNCLDPAVRPNIEDSEDGYFEEHYGALPLARGADPRSATESKKEHISRTDIIRGNVLEVAAAVLVRKAAQTTEYCPPKPKEAELSRMKSWIQHFLKTKWYGMWKEKSGLFEQVKSGNKTVWRKKGGVQTYQDKKGQFKSGTPCDKRKGVKKSHAGNAPGLWLTSRRNT